MNTDTPTPKDKGWIGHEWKMRGFYSDQCIHCGTIAVDGHGGAAKDREHCAIRAQKVSKPTYSDLERENAALREVIRNAHATLYYRMISASDIAQAANIKRYWPDYSDVMNDLNQALNPNTGTK